MKSTQLRFIRNIKKTAILLITTFFVASFLATSCSKTQPLNTQALTKEEIQTRFAVSTTYAVQGDLKDYLEFGGDVNAKTNIEVMPDAVGRIVELNVAVGSFVTKDQIIAMVDPSRPGMNYAYSPVKAPISGTITAVNIVVGSMVSQLVSIIRISKTDALQITMSVPERYVSKIKMNQNASIKFDAYPGESFAAVVSEISPVLDQSSRTMNVKLSFTNQDFRIKAGMFARVKLTTDTRENRVIIPESSIVSRFGEQFVFIVKNKEGSSAQVVKQTVTVGIRVDDKIEISEGLFEGDEIVVRGQTLLEDGARVNIVAVLDSLLSVENDK